VKTNKNDCDETYTARARLNALAVILIVALSLATRVFPASVTYTYDAAGRLTAVAYDDGASVSYTLDAAGNRKNVTAVAVTPVVAPSGLTVSPASATSMNLSWSKPTGGNGTYTYSIYRAGSFLKSVTATSATDSGLSAYTNYSYTVSATDSDGNTSPQSTAVSHYTYANPIIGSLTAATVSSSAITVTWSATDANGPSGGLTYSLQRGTTILSNCTASPCPDSGLTAGTPYTYTLTATDMDGDYATATANGGTYPLPSIQTFTAVPASSTSMTLNWTVTDNGGPGGPLTYSVTRNGTTVPNCTAAPCTDSPLAPGTTYTYILTADDSKNDPSTATAMGTTLPNPPSAPGTPTFSLIATTTATASWSAATGTVTSYSYSLNSGTWINNGTTQSVNLSGLTGATNYTLQVLATNSGGNGPASSGSFTTNPYTDTPVMTQGSNMATENGFNTLGADPIGSMSPATTTNGYTYQQFMDKFKASNGAYQNTLFSVSGFSADPGQGWLTSAGCNVTTQTGSTATYSYSAGMATWNWTTGKSFGQSGNVNCTIVHK
jgi:YD repeat-containing protein